MAATVIELIDLTRRRLILSQELRVRDTQSICEDLCFGIMED